MAQRWQLAKAQTILDAGCGIGYWGQLLSRVLPDDIKFQGIDREADWVTRATLRAKNFGLSDRFSYLQGDVNALPVAHNTYDAVTCQTLLTHVSDPVRVLKEFFRVLKPGGLIIAVEPNNLSGSLVFSNLDLNKSVPELLPHVEFEMLCEKGKMALGEGSNSVGDLIPGYVAHCGFESVDVYLSDKASPFIPPYVTDAERATIAQGEDWERRDFLRWSLEDTRGYYLAGGGVVSSFVMFWPQAMGQRRAATQTVKKGDLHSAGGVITYLVSGRKPLHCKTIA